MFTRQNKTVPEIAVEVLRLGCLDPAGDELAHKLKTPIVIQLLPGGAMLDCNWELIMDERSPMTGIFHAAAREVQTRWRIDTPFLGSTATNM
jgi:hypothetical protein